MCVCVPLCAHTHILGTERSLSVNETRRVGVKLVCSHLLYKTLILSTAITALTPFGINKLLILLRQMSPNFKLLLHNLLYVHLFYCLNCSRNLHYLW